MESPIQMENQRLNVFKKLPRTEITYFSQIILIFIIVVTSIVNISLQSPHHDLWVALLASSIGVLLPPPVLSVKQ